MATEEEIHALNEAAREQVRAMNDAGFLVDWSLSNAECPKCHVRGQVEVRQVMRATPLGQFSLAGSQVKFPVKRAWEFRCGTCGASGAAEPK